MRSFYFLGLAILLAFVASIHASFVIDPHRFTAVPSQTFLVDEDFEGSGAPTGWTVINGTAPDYDYTTGPIEGLESMRMQPNVTRRVGSPDFGATGNHVKFTIELTDIASVDDAVWGLRTSADVTIVYLTIDSLTATTARWKITVNGVDSAWAVGELTEGTTYDIWADYTAGGITSMAIAAEDGAKPTSGDYFLSGTDTVSAAADYCYWLTFANQADYKVDKVKVSATTIN